MIRLTDELTRNLRRNVYVNKIKDIETFIELIHNIFKSITGNVSMDNFFYRFDRSLAIEILKREKYTFDYKLHLRGIKTGAQVFVEDLYALLYIFFVNFKINSIKREDLVGNILITLNISFSVSDNNLILVKNTLKRIKELKLFLEGIRLRYVQNRERRVNSVGKEDIFITR